MATAAGSERHGALPRRSRSELRTLPVDANSQAADLFKQMDPFEVGYVELDIIKELLLRLKSATLRDEVEQLLHEHVFTEGSFLLSKEDFVFKWEAAHPRHRGRQSPSQRLHKPPKVFLKLQDLRPPAAPPAAPPAEVQEVMQKLGPSELLGIVQRRRSQPDKKSRVPPKYIGRARPVEQTVELVSETVEVHKRLQLMRQS